MSRKPSHLQVEREQDGGRRRGCGCVNRSQVRSQRTCSPERMKPMGKTLEGKKTPVGSRD